MCVTDRHDMTLAVKVALNPSTANQIATFNLSSTKFNAFNLDQTKILPFSKEFYLSAMRISMQYHP